MFFTKYNYDIYDKKLIIIIKAFKKWYSELAGTSIKDSI